MSNCTEADIEFARLLRRSQRLERLLRHADKLVVWEHTGVRAGFQEEVEAALAPETPTQRVIISTGDRVVVLDDALPEFGADAAWLQGREGIVYETGEDSVSVAFHARNMTFGVDELRRVAMGELSEARAALRAMMNVSPVVPPGHEAAIEAAIANVEADAEVSASGQRR